MQAIAHEHSYLRSGKSSNAPACRPSALLKLDHNASNASNTSNSFSQRPARTLSTRKVHDHRTASSPVSFELGLPLPFTSQSYRSLAKCCVVLSWIDPFVFGQIFGCVGWSKPTVYLRSEDKPDSRCQPHKILRAPNIQFHHSPGTHSGPSAT